MSDLCGVYAIINLVSDKRYFGSTVRPIVDRLKEHLSELRFGRHCNKHLTNAWNKYGEDAFVFTAIEEYPLGTTQEAVEAREKIYIDLFWGLGTIYNITKLPGCPAAPWTDERKRAHSEMQKASWLTQERRQNELVSWSRGRKENLSRAITKTWEDADQRRQTMSEWRKALWTDEQKKAHMEFIAEFWTEDRRQQMSETQKATWTDEKKKNLDIARSKWLENGGREHLFKLSQEYWTEERRQEHAELVRGQWTEERRKKARESYTEEKRKMHSDISKKLGCRPPDPTGSKHTEATKAKMSETAKRIWTPERKAIAAEQARQRWAKRREEKNAAKT